MEKYIVFNKYIKRLSKLDKILAMYGGRWLVNLELVLFRRPEQNHQSAFPNQALNFFCLRPKKKPHKKQ